MSLTIRPLATALGVALAMSTAQAANPDYSLTIYSSAQPGQLNPQSLQNYGVSLPGYALVRDRRELTLEQGRAKLRFSDVAAQIDPTTVNFASITDPAGTRVVEQNYEFDLVDGQKLLNRYIGEKIAVDQIQGDTMERITGTLLSASNGLILMKDTGEVLTLTHYANVQFPSLPGGLITKPTLVWLVDAKRGGKHDAQVSYQTTGMTWWSDYNVILSGTEDNCKMDLSAWVTIVNQSGASFPEAELKLVAGEVNRAPAAPQPAMVGMMRAKTMELAAAPADTFQEESLFEYHLYKLGRRTDLPQNSTKQLELFPAIVGSTCKRELVFTASELPYRWWGPLTDQGYNATREGEVGAYLEFQNKEANGMGIPLPAGRVRVNQAAKDGSLEFIGEDLIKHKPRNEDVRIKLGKSFDVVGERKQVDFRIDTDKKWLEETFEISIRNRKQVATKVVAREYLYRWSQWSITESSRDYAKKDAATVDFPLSIEADGEAKVRYTVRYTW